MALSKDVLKLWRGDAEQTANPTWSGFLRWTASMLAVELQTESEKALESLLNQEQQQGTESIQKHNVAFNRLVQKLQGDMVQNQYTLMLLYRSSLSNLYARHSHYDASGNRFSTLADMQQHLLKQEGIIKKKERDGSLLKKQIRPEFRGEQKKKKRFLAKGTRDTPITPQTPNPRPPVVAAVQAQPSEQQPRRRPPAKEHLLGEAQDPCIKNQNISNQQYRWLMQKGYCTFCTQPRAECCPATTDRCLVKKAVEQGSKADVAGCPSWRR